MKWFGESWGAPVCDPDNHHAATPVGRLCVQCQGTIREGAQGFIVPYLGARSNDDALIHATTVVYHIDCLMNAVGLRKS